MDRFRRHWGSTVRLGEGLAVGLIQADIKYNSGFWLAKLKLKS